MKLSELCRATGIALPVHCTDPDIAAITADSRCAEANCLYICIKGLHTDGHTYIKEAVEKGAICILTQDGSDAEIPNGIPRLSVADTRKTSALLYNAFYGDPCSRLKFVGVTGTNGKTSVTHMLRAVLEASLCKCGLIGTAGCESAGRHLNSQSSDALANMTTPDPPVLYRILAEMAEDGVEYVLMEVTSHALALGKLEPIRFEAGIFTNLTPEHLDFHKTMQAYADAKAELFRRSRICVINSDSPYADHMIKASNGRVVTCGTHGGETYTAERIQADARTGVDYELCSERSRLRIQCPIPGSFTVANSMQTAVCALELGFGASAVKVALAALAGVRGRMERLRLGVGADFGVIIDYAHTPDALERVLRTVKASDSDRRRVVLVFGCGGDRDRSKRPMMGAIATRYADRVIVTSDNSRSEEPKAIIEDILSGCDREKVTVIEDRGEAIRFAVLNAEKNDLLLLAGKGHEEYEINRLGRLPFSEREIVRAAFEEKKRREYRKDSTDPKEHDG